MVFIQNIQMKYQKNIKNHIDEVNEYEKQLKSLDKFKNTNEDLNDDENWLVFNYNFQPIPEKKHIITHIALMI